MLIINVPLLRAVNIVKRIAIVLNHRTLKNNLVLVQWVVALAAKPGDLNLIPGHTLWKEKSQLLQTVLSLSHIPCTDTHTQK